MAGFIKAKKIVPADVYVGERIRAMRIEKGLSQTDLGNRLGVTFQQVQKYEKGVNRVSAGRLAAIADLFETTIMSFYPDGKQAKAGYDPCHEMSQSRSGVELARAFNMLDSAKRAVVLSVAEALGK